MGNPFQGVIDWLAGILGEILAALNPINLIMSLAGYVASLLPDPNPAVIDIINQGVDAVMSVARYISLFDYIINLPVYLAVIAIMFGISAFVNVPRAWRFLRSFVT